MNPTPRVSILVPMRNAEPFVEMTLNSILLETDIFLEVVVINDKSTDRSLERVDSVRDRRIRVVEGPGIGISACLNAGLDAARGDIIMRCDADDLYSMMRISNQVDWLDANPEYAAVCGSFSMMDTHGRLLDELPTGGVIEEITGELNSGNTRTSLCTYAIRSDVIQGMGGFRPYFVTAEDIDFQLRLAEFGRVMYLPQTFYRYRLHDASITHTQSNEKRIFFENTARLFQVQRKVSGQDDLQRGCPAMPPEAISDKPGTATHQIQGVLTGAAWREHATGSRLKAVGLGWRALSQSPPNPKMWWSLLALLVKPTKKN